MNYIGIARKYRTPRPVILTVSELEWCKAALQERINLDKLQDQIDWEELQISLKQCGEDEWKIDCRLPLHDLFKTE